MLFSAFYDHFFPFLLINARLTGLLVFAPVFGHSAIPNRIKGGMIIMFTIIIHFGLGIGFEMGAMPIKDLVVFAIAEFGAGAAMGLAIQLFFSAISYSAGIIAPQMGMAIAQLIDPQSQSMQPLLSTFFSLISIILFLSIDGHLYLLHALSDSYRLVPIGGFTVSGTFIDELIRISSELFSIAFRLAAPILAVIIFMNTGMALLAKAVPQINVLVVGFIITISVGIYILSLVLPALSPVFQDIMMNAVERALWLMKAV